MAHRGNGSEQRNYTTVNQGSESSGGLGPSNNAPTCQDGPTSIEVEHVLLDSESGNYPIQYSQTSNRRNTVQPIETRSGNPQQNLTPSTQMPWATQLKNDYVQTRKDWVCWEHTPVDFRDDDITFVVKTAKRMEQILIHHYDIEVPVGKKNNLDLREVIERAAKMSQIRNLSKHLKSNGSMHRFRMIRNKLVHNADFNHVKQNERRIINTACMEIFLALDKECNCKELTRNQKQESYRLAEVTGRSAIFILPDEFMYIDNKGSRQFIQLVEPQPEFVSQGAQRDSDKHGQMEQMNIISSMRWESAKPEDERAGYFPSSSINSYEEEIGVIEVSCFDMLEDLIRKNPNLRDILDEDQESVSSEGELLERQAEDTLYMGHGNAGVSTTEDEDLSIFTCSRKTKLQILKVGTRVFLNEAGQFGAAFFMKEQYFNQAEMYPRFLIGLLKLCAFEGLNGLLRHWT